MILIAYIIVPLLSSFLRPWLPKGMNYLITFLLLFLYPGIVFSIDDYLHPLSPEEALRGRCGMPVLSFWYGHLVIFLPASLLLQWLFNRMHPGRKKKKMMNT